MSGVCLMVDDTRIEYDAWIRRDWTVGTDATQFKSLLRHAVSLYQVVSCRDVRISQYRQLGNEDGDDDAEGDDGDSAKLHGNSSATRMLRLLLFDGNSHRIAYEYEPIACLDVFHANRLTGKPVRCCGKIALFNGPVERRGAMWLTRGNVKLVFEGFVCKKQDLSQSCRLVYEPSQEISGLCTQNQYGSLVISSNSVDMTQQDESDHMACDVNEANGFKYGSFKRDAHDVLDFALPIKRFNAHTKDIRNLSPLETYFPNGSTYLDFSYISYLVRSNCDASEASFEDYAKTFLLAHGFKGSVSIAQALSHVNKSPCISEPSSTWLGDNAHFGFLDHAVPLSMVDQSDISDVASKELRDASFDDNDRLWLVNLNDCVACFFCLVSLETLGLVERTPLATSRQINSIEGFFGVKRLCSENSSLYWISQYRRRLDDEELAKRIQLIQSEYEGIETLLEF
ncbi:uncharacterized protein BXIN_1986 [Babesia sp. Xinjiang]|uniref:uncharacterized protein n=1 Tax=Babesia sp. Xinjiang TaxID=462227 RepID=UPI000A248563|nr:uncharacterized protein BXIN_1986 [Babesia sp. Xinjiang]ORM40359.1 hypothetical protein BXIN_1986 [Babesia sp. Xinjiang]